MVGTAHNVEDVIDDVGDVQDELEDNTRSAVKRGVTQVRLAVRKKIQEDPDASGTLEKAIRQTVNRRRGSVTGQVFMSGRRAPYHNIVEFGSGTRTDIVWPYGNDLVAAGSGRPVDYPFDSPSEDVLPVVVDAIEEWISDKPIKPKTGSVKDSAFAIASTIVDKGTYAHPYFRPAWFENKYDVEASIHAAVKRAVS